MNQQPNPLFDGFQENMPEGALGKAEGGFGGGGGVWSKFLKEWGLGVGGVGSLGGPLGRDSMLPPARVHT